MPMEKYVIGWWWFSNVYVKEENKEHLRSVMKEYKELNLI